MRGEDTSTFGVESWETPSKCSTVLQPIHLARVALLQARADGATGVPIDPRDRPSLTVDPPGLDATLFMPTIPGCADFARRMLDALGWPVPSDW